MIEHNDLLVEVGTEELPPKSLLTLAQAFAEQLQQQFAAAQLPIGACHVYATPRRLAVRINQVAVQQPARDQEKRGPALNAAYDAAGNPSKAAEGFARSCGVSFAELQTLKTDKGEWLVHRFTEAGKATASLIAEFIQQALAALPIAKRMRWGDKTAEFVRPVHWLVILFGQQVIPAQILGVNSGAISYGHRFHAPQAIQLKSADDYLPALEKAYVLADFGVRRARIEQQIIAAAHELHAQALMTAELLDEVTSLVEWPSAVVGSFDPDFLRVPAEALISTMQGNQKYFALRDAQQQLLPYFITIANLQSRDVEKVRQGNERVIRPRFADAAFFWDQDRKQTLASRAPALDQVVFQKQLGSLGDKSRRVAVTAAAIGAELGGNAEWIARAALLSKCDLLSNMVFEFTELQGTMGRYYAQHDAEPAEVAMALEEQYLPRFAGDHLPQTKTGQALAIADRLDSLLGIFAIGQKPSGVKDPYALRRAALSVCRIILSAELVLDVPQLLQQAAAQFDKQLNVTAVVDEVAAFIFERLRAYYLSGDNTELPITPQHFDAVLSQRPRQIVDFHRRLLGLVAFSRLPAADSLAAANKRIHNLLRKVEGALPEQLNPQLFQEAAERDLNAALDRIEAEATPYLQAGDYVRALEIMAALKPSVDGFFDAVMVMAEELPVRQNRLALLQRVSNVFLQVADLSLLPGGND